MSYLLLCCRVIKKTTLVFVLTLFSGIVDEVFRHLQVLWSSIRECSVTVAAATSSLRTQRS